MIVRIETEVNSCKECPHSTNSSIEHSCSFTSAPYPTVWWCTKGKDKWGDHLYINDTSEILEDCPEKKRK